MRDTEESQRHWLELAEQLGLPPESAEPPFTAGSAPPPQLSKSEPSRNFVEKEATGAKAAQPHEPLSEPVESPPGDESQVEREAPAQLEEERRPQRGRRRGRRGGRRPERSPAEREGVEAADEEAPEVRERAAEDDGAEPSQQEHSRRRGRGRSRRKKEPAVSDRTPVAVDEPVAPEHETPQSADEGPDEDNDDMSGWTIPSWQELIDSLYRPDR